MKKILLLLLLILLIGFLSAKKVGPLPEVMKPDNISINKDDLFVAEGSTVYVYSIRTMQLKKRFGKKGEGPGEIMSIPNYPTRINGYPEYILVEGLNKIIFFTRKGKFIKEKRKPTGTTQMIPIGNHFVAKRVVPSEDNRTINGAIYLYDSNLKPLKTLYSQKWVQQGAPPNVEIDMVGDFVHFRTCDGKIFIEESPLGFIIGVFDETGNKLYEIKKSFKPIKVTGAHKEQLITNLREDPWTKPQIRALGGWEEVKKILDMQFPDYFPPIRSLDISDNRLLIQTFREKSGKDEYIIMDLKGNIQKTVYVPRRAPTPLMARLMGVKLYAIEKDNLYYIKENEEEEEWELHVETLK
jgi:hypothetical protein